MKVYKKSLAVVLGAALLLGIAGCGKKDVNNTTNATEEKKDNTDYIGSISEDTLKINSDGSILEVACEDYGEAAVDYSGLKAYITDSVDVYNQSNGDGKITFLQYVDDNSVVKVAMLYADIDTYNEFNSTAYVVSSYDAQYCNDIVKKYINEEAADEGEEEQPDLSDMSAEELAEAGLASTDLNQGGVAETIEESAVIATFTDAEGTEVASDKVPENMSMIVVDSAMNIILPEGEIIYINSHASLSDSKNVSTDGEGEAIIIYSNN